MTLTLPFKRIVEIAAKLELKKKELRTKKAGS